MEPEMSQQVERKAAATALLDAHPFRAAPWFRGPHRQTFYGPLFRRDDPPQYQLERWDTPDRDFVRVHIIEGQPDKPVLFQLHGLEGNVRSFYVSGLTKVFAALGWTVAVLEFRGCGGELNRAPRFYHMGETSDPDLVLRGLIARYPDRPFFLTGVSLGGNVLAKWLGEQGANVPHAVKAAAVISAPFNPLISAPDFHKILGGFYAWNFLRSLVPKALEKAKIYPDLLDPAAIAASKDFYAFDTVVTARLHGFEDAVDYWRRVGCHQFLPEVRVPLLLLSSADDPFNPAETLPHEVAVASPYLHPQFTREGGHVGFVAQTKIGRMSFWAEEQVERFFRFYLETA